MGISADQWNTYPEHFWLRGEKPEKYVEYDERLEIWNVYGYPESVEILTQPKIFSNDTKDLDPVKWDDWVNAGDFAQMDPPEHRKFRGLVDYAFTPKLVADLRSQVHTLIDELIDDLADRDGFDLVAEFSNPLPLSVICELVGVPASDRHLFHTWMQKMLDGTGDYPEPEAVREQTDELQYALGLLGEMRDYWTDLAKERIRRPREDLMSRLVHAEVDGERLAIPEVCNIANRLLVAGHSSTDMLISNTVLSLDAFPEQRRAVSADRSLMPRVIEESLRYLSPISAVGRGTKVDAEVGGVVIPKDQMIMVWAAAANRDERQFKNPHAFDIMREEGGHLAFSRGVHFCLGRRLGRMEAQAAVGRLMDRFPKLRTDPDNPPEFFQFADATGMEKLPVLVR